MYMCLYAIDVQREAFSSEDPDMAWICWAEQLEATHCAVQDFDTIFVCKDLGLSESKEPPNETCSAEIWT